ncbi:hypothetical protein CR194_05970 [Salipaludibacillus keqinensis]|uniref:HTH luxR-type domain-containing protein n=1 Tax=Salipaludibacillus keqinensis TaxID=2045207 RepID=A0A323TJV4_9BACI|nr:LuxR C-terminal-related transcriptional regulator [Salipaludibacillus keqinensis]PYZ95059.1 hypothetical protein CR194_05970 [Salipaludibacillus keqinensis]
MININDSRVNTFHFNVMFNDPKDMIFYSLKESIDNYLNNSRDNNLISIDNVEKKNWVFYAVEGYSEQTKEFLEKQLHLTDEHSKTVLVVQNTDDKQLLKYLLLPINGIVSLSLLSSHSDFVLESILKTGVYLDQDLHKDISCELAFLKSYSTPIKQMHLNKNKITVDLTERDHQVLQLLLEGNNNSEIAEKMHFARSTVSTIMSSLLKKMKAKDRTDVTVKTIRNGWVDCYR